MIGNRIPSAVLGALLLLLGPVTAGLRGESLPPCYEELLDHGAWFMLSDRWVWQPRAARADPSWRPYFTGGCWHWENNTWFWTSDYLWGAVAFHHGRWFLSPVHGWLWVPGTEWSPAWVSWRIADDVCGWAPLPPDTAFLAAAGMPAYELTWSHFVFVPAWRLQARDLTLHRLDGSLYAGRAQATALGPSPASASVATSFVVTDGWPGRWVVAPPPACWASPVVWSHSSFCRCHHRHHRLPPPPPLLLRHDRGFAPPRPPPPFPRGGPRPSPRSAGGPRPPPRGSGQGRPAPPPRGAGGRGR
jgi:hypothetical protein